MPFFKFWLPKFWLPKPPPKPTIVDVVVDVSGSDGFDTNGGDFDLLREALEATNLTDAVADRHADLTVFAPTDAAFAELAATFGYTGDPTDEAAVFAFIAGVTGYVSPDEPGLLDDVLLYHVAPDGRSVAQLQADGTIGTLLSGASVTVDGNELVDADPDVENPESVAGLTDIKTANGTIQAIDRVLLPLDLEEAVAQPSIADLVVATSGADGFDTNPDDFDLLREALEATDLLGAVADRGADLTVFAPTDAAFTELAVTLGFTGDTADEGAVFSFLASATGFVSAAEPGLLDDVLLYHVAPGARTVEELRDEGTITTLEGGTVTIDGDTVVDADPDVENPEFIDGATDIEAVNGNIQGIDRVLLPLNLDEAVAQPSIVDLVVETSGADGFDTNSGDFDLLREALEATDLLGVVADRDADFTVFAPTDAAFTALAIDLGFDGDPADEAAVFGFIAGATGFVSADQPGLLDDVLLYHVSPEGKTVAELQDAGKVATAQGGDVTVQGTTLVDKDPDLKDPKLIDGATDLEAVNGVVQAIDRVLLPADIDDATPEPNVIKGNFFRNHLNGTDGDDKIFGFSGRDRLSGNDGDDKLYGGFGRDWLDGGDGDDMLFGGLGRDHLSGGAGDDTLTGGFGRDTFDFSALEGHDTVTDFGWRDRLVFSKDDFADKKAILDAAQDQGAGTFIETDAGSVFLVGVDADHLNERDFLLV